MKVSELIAQLQRFNPDAEVVQSFGTDVHSPTVIVEAGLYEAAADPTVGVFWVPVDEQPWIPEPGVDVHAVCLWPASWPFGENDETGA